MAIFGTKLGNLFGGTQSNGVIGQNMDTNVASKDSPLNNNPAADTFLKTAEATIASKIDKYSVSKNVLSLGNSDIDPYTDSIGSLDSFSLSNKVATTIVTDKPQRIDSYNTLSRYPELDWCINEICSDFWHDDSEGNYFNFSLKNLATKFTHGEEEVLKNEFNRFISLFDFQTNGYNIIRQFLVEGECCFENIIDTTDKEKGIIAERYIPAKHYEFLRNSQTGEMIGIYLDKNQIRSELNYGFVNGGYNHGAASNIFNAIRPIPGYSYANAGTGLTPDQVALPWEQVTYFNTGIYADNTAKTIVYPIIEKVATPVRQLLLLHDACIILRITRAPQKMVFNFDLTGCNAKQAQEFVRRWSLMHKSKKSVSMNGEVRSSYDSESMLDAFYFWKCRESAGCTVQSLPETAHYNELNDIEYFLYRIMKFLNIPHQHWKEDGINRQDINSITNEEYSFAQSEVRYQTMLAAAIKHSYIVDLKLKGLWDKFGLAEGNIYIRMNQPALYNLNYAKNIFSVKLDVAKALTDLPYISRNRTLKQIFSWTDEEVTANEEAVRKEKEYDAVTEFLVAQTKNNGVIAVPPSDIPSPEQKPTPPGQNAFEQENPPEGAASGEGPEPVPPPEVEPLGIPKPPKGPPSTAVQVPDNGESLEDIVSANNGPESSEKAFSHEKKEEPSENGEKKQSGLSNIPSEEEIDRMFTYKPLSDVVSSNFEVPSSTGAASIEKPKAGTEEYKPLTTVADDHFVGIIRPKAPAGKSQKTIPPENTEKTAKKEKSLTYTFNGYFERP